MSSIPFVNYTPVPNLEIDNLCLNRHVSVKVRVKWAIIRLIAGYAENRGTMSAKISYGVLERKTGASKRQIIRAIKLIEAEGEMGVGRSQGRGHRNIYYFDFNGKDKR